MVCRSVISATLIFVAVGCATESAATGAADQGQRDAGTVINSSRDAARICEASAPRPPSDAAPSGEEPPAHCVAPCVWELMKHCLVSGPCTTEAIAPSDPSSNPFGGGSVTCARGGAVWDIASNGHYSSLDEFFSGDCPCYSFAALGGGDPSLLAYQWIDASHRVVATGDGSDHVVCGPFDMLHTASVHFPGEAHLDDGGLIPGFTEYRLSTESPDCAPWIRPQCTQGTCASSPPQLPQQF